MCEIVFNPVFLKKMKLKCKKYFFIRVSSLSSFPQVVLEIKDLHLIKHFSNKTVINTYHRKYQGFSRHHSFIFKKKTTVSRTNLRDSDSGHRSHADETCQLKALQRTVHCSRSTQPSDMIHAMLDTVLTFHLNINFRSYFVKINL